jgi:hypothetical protein
MAGDFLPIESKLLISHQHVGQDGFESRHALNTTRYVAFFMTE